MEDPASLPKKTPFRKSKVIQVLLFLPIVIFMSGDLAIVLANKLAIQVSLGDMGNGVDITISLQYLSTGVATLIFGYMSDKMNRKILLMIGGTMWVVGLFATAAATNLLTFGLFRSIAAFGLGSSAPVSFSLLSDIFASDKRSNGFAWWGVANMIGTAAGGGLGLVYNQIPYTALSAQFGSNTEAELAYIFANYKVQAELWREPFIMFGWIALITVIFVLLVREPKRAAEEKSLHDVLSDANVDYSKSYKIRKEDLKYIVVRRSNIFLILNFFATTSGGLITAYLVTYITLEMGFSVDFASGLTPDLIFLLLGIVVGLGISLIGQFRLSKIADKKMASGDNRGRIKMLIISSFAQIPFLTVAFLMTPSVGQMTFFRGALPISNPVIFWALFFVLLILIGLGLMFSFGGTNCWYASIIDANLPEHRGTMIAVGTTLDAIGRSLGITIGSYFLVYFETNNVPTPYGMTMMVMTVIFGTISSIMVVPLLMTWNKDYTEVQGTLKQRAEELKQKVAPSQVPPARDPEDMEIDADKVINRVGPERDPEDLPR
jgi:MFS family permease